MQIITRIWRTALLLSIALIGLSGCDPLKIITGIGSDESQGIFGTVLISPGVCLEDPDNPGECLNGPFPGVGTFDIRRYADQPNLGIDNPIIRTFQSEENGAFRVELPAGKYCIWGVDSSCTEADIEADEWLNLTLHVALP